MRVVNTVRPILIAALALGSIADATTWTFDAFGCKGGSTLVTGSGCIALKTVHSRSAGTISQCGECADSHGTGFLSTRSYNQRGNCSGGRPRLANSTRLAASTRLVQQLDYIEAHIDLGEYHIYRENEDFFQSKKDERSNREMLMVEKPYNL
ncbi:hypothetical protein EDD21DRAFT_388943 [Dissophora ornata]|nr:hypothetical protein EDD21DRAFT_388943 [Dissophora ornata]